MPTKSWIEVPIEQEIVSVPESGYAPYFFPADGGKAVFSFTEDSFMKVLSALINGAALTYPDDWIQVVWYFLESVEFPVSICSQIIDCIENDTDVRTVLSQFIAEHPGGTKLEKNKPLPETVSGSNILEGNPECDPDILWTQCIGIVQTANRMVEDFLQTWETYNNAGEVLSDVVAGIPGLAELTGAIGLSGILEYANDLVDSIGEAYLADYTLEYEQELACQIFCLAKDDCTVTIAMLTEIMNTRVGDQLNLENLTELLKSVIDQDISGFNVADLYLAFFFDALLVANLVIPITWGIEAFLRSIAIFNEPSDDWIALCVDCPSGDNTWTKWFFPDEPPDTNKGTYVLDGLTIVFTAGFSYGAYRVGWQRGDCFTILSTDYGTKEFPNSINCAGDISTDPPIVGGCYKAIVAASSSPFTVTVTYEDC
jgi:hypothetical protein